MRRCNLKLSAGMLKVVRRGLLARGHNKYTVTSSDIIDMAFHHRQGSKVVAAIYAISPTWVNTLRKFTAAAYLHYQHWGLGQLAELARHRPPLFTLSRLAYDETGEKLTLPLGDMTNASVWQVLVARLELIVGWSDASGQPVIKFSAVLPTLLVASPNAANIYHSLFFHTQLAPLHTALMMLQAASTWAVDLQETDGAYACDRLWAHMLKLRGRSPTLDCHFRCRLHATQLIEALILAVLPGKMLSRMYSLILFLRTGGYWARMVKEVLAFISNHFRYKPIAEFGPPPAEAREFAYEVANFIVAHYKRFENISDQADSDSESESEEFDWDSLQRCRDPLKSVKHAGPLRLIMALLDLMAVCNSKLWEEEVDHFCMGGLMLLAAVT